MKRIFFVVALTAVFSLAAATCFAQKPKLRVPQNVTVVDSKGKIVAETAGNFWFINVGVLLELNGVVLRVSIDRFGFQQSALFFQSTDCSGTPLLPVLPDSIFVTTAVGFPGSTVYVPDPNAAVQVLILQSIRRGNSCTPGGFGSLAAAPAIALIDLDTEFTPPFSVRTRP